jgi:putative acetyltransferase
MSPRPVFHAKTAYMATTKNDDREAELEAIVTRLTIEQAVMPTAEIIEMLTELDAAMSGPYVQRHALSVEQLFQPDVRFFVVRLDGAAVACGGIAFYHGYAELKRMYSRPAVRGRGVAKLLLRRLETEARAVGATLLRLETGVYQHEALRFYEGAGFQRRGPFGRYADMPPHAIETSLFYEKAV